MDKILESFEILKKSFDEKMISRDIIKKKLDECELRIVELQSDIEDGKKVEILFQEVAQQTQSNIEDHISNLVTLALKSVSPSFPNFIVQFVIRRKQLEADLLFEKDGNLSNPMYCSGGGPKDIASFGLLIANWSIDRTRATIVLDEPFRQVSPDLQDKVSDMLRMLSKELGLQIIMVSHADAINYSADKTFVVEMKNGTSRVKELS